MNTKPITATASGYLVGDGSASPAVVRGVKVYKFIAKGATGGTIAIFRDGGPSGAIKAILSVGVAGDQAEDDRGQMGCTFRTDCYVAITNLAGSADPAGGRATIIVDGQFRETY